MFNDTNRNKRKRLFAGAVTANKNEFAGAALANKNEFAGTAPENKNMLGFVPMMTWLL